MLTLFHDYASAASAVASLRALRLGVPVVLEPFEPVPLDASVGVGVEVLADLDRLADEAAAEGLRLRRPAWLPSTGRAHLVAGTASAVDLGPQWHRAAYRALWEQGRDLGDDGVLLDLASGIGLERRRVEQVLADGAALAHLRRGMGKWRRRGVGGVPVLLADHTLVPGLVDERTWRDLATWEPTG